MGENHRIFVFQALRDEGIPIPSNVLAEEVYTWNIDGMMAPFVLIGPRGIVGVINQRKKWVKIAEIMENSEVAELVLDIDAL